MNGGTITENTAVYGGGVYAYSDNVTLNAGYITNNTAKIGGGVYSEGNSIYFKTIQLYNVLITENTATSHGGGMWFCPTGAGAIYVTNGGAVTKNTANGAGDDVAFAKGSDTSLTLAERILGGGKTAWYTDGSVLVDSSSGWTQTGSALRYADEGYSYDELDELTLDSSAAVLALVDGDGLTLAETMATLFITGNTATYGGGVGANGGVTIGSKEVTSVTVNKIWENGENTNIPESITLKLYNKGYEIEEITLTAADVTIEEDGSWSYTFENLPLDGEYSVTEEEIPSYSAEISNINEDNVIVITNTYTGEDEDPETPDDDSETPNDPETPDDESETPNDTDAPNDTDSPSDDTQETEVPEDESEEISKEDVKEDTDENTDEEDASNVESEESAEEEDVSTESTSLTDSSDTGDHSKIILWLSILVLCEVILLTACIRQYKRKKRR